MIIIILGFLLACGIFYITGTISSQFQFTLNLFNNFSSNIRIDFKQKSSTDFEFDEIVYSIPQPIVIRSPDSTCMNQAAKLIDHIESLIQSNGDDYYKVTHLDIYPTIVYYIQDISEENRIQNLLDVELSNTRKLFDLVLPTELVQRITFSDPKLSFSVQVCSIMSLSLSPLETSPDSSTFSQLFTTFHNFESSLFSL
jgi:hypothetical protein